MKEQKKPKVTKFSWVETVESKDGTDYSCYYFHSQGFTFKAVWVGRFMSGWYLLVKHFFFGDIQNRKYSIYDDYPEYRVGLIGKNFSDVEKEVGNILIAIDIAKGSYDREMTDSYFDCALASYFDCALAKIDEG